MRSHHSAGNNHEYKTGVAVILVSVSFLIGATGCSSPKAAVKASSATVSKNTNSHGLVKLTASEIEQKIKAVQANANLPESAKPKIIESIRAQGEP